MLVYIKPLSTFPKLHSDTLFGAFTSAVNELYPDKVDAMINKFEDGLPPFILSSAFPVIFDGDEKIRFYPKIILDSDLKDIDSKIIKDYKKVDYIEEGLFFDLIQSKITEREILENYNHYNRFSNLLYKKELKVNVGFGENILPHNMVNRLNTSTEIFYTEGDSYSNIGLFFIVDILDNDYDEIITSALKFLKDRGFGRDISTGKGHFEFEIDENYQLDDYEGNTFITLSRFIPTDDDLKRINEYSFYELDSKRGRDKSGEIRRQVRFFKEGSTFPNYQKYYGCIVKSGDVNPAVEYGYAFPIRFNRDVK